MKQRINPIFLMNRAGHKIVQRVGANTYVRSSGGTLVPSFALHAFGAENGTIKSLVKGTGLPTFARTTEGTVKGYDGLIKMALLNEPRIDDARRIENLVNRATDAQVSSEINVATIDWNTIGTSSVAPDNQTVSLPGLFDGIEFYVRNYNTPIIGKTIVVLILLSGNGDIQFRNRDFSGSEGTAAVITTTSTPQWFSVSHTYTTSADIVMGFWLRKQGEPTPATVIKLQAYQIEEVTDQANQNPGDYVSVGVLSYPYHGIGVDSVADFSYENGNTVSSNIVNEAKGADLTTEWGALFEPASTNYSDTTNDLTGGAETVDLTTPGTGDYTLSVKGSASVTVAAGTAVGTGFGIATDGNNIKFNLSTAGTVTLTLNSGTLSQTQSGKYRKQVEKLAVETSLIETSGTAVTRTADDGSSMFDINGNVDLTKGSMVVDLQWDSDYNDLSQANEALIAFTNIANNFLYYASDEGSIYSNDGTNACKISLSFVAGKTYRIGLTWSVDNGINISFKNVTDSGSWQPWANTSFDGAYEGEQTGEIRVAYPNLLYRPTRFRDLRLWLQDMGTQFIEDSY